MSQQQKAVLVLEPGKIEVGTVPILVPQGKQALVKLTAVAINPVDWKMAYDGLFITEFPTIVGLDGAGVIESVGPEVTAFKKGDKVFFQGQLTGKFATFQEYTPADTEIMSIIPDNISDDQASTFPLTSFTAVAGLFQNSGVAFPETGPTAAGKGIFITGGSSSVGQYAIQLARIAGFSPIVTTASSQHTELLKSLGATQVLDRNVDAKTVQAAFPASVSFVFDIISSDATRELAVDILTTPSPVAGAHLANGHPRPLGDLLKEKAEGKISVSYVFGDPHRFKDLGVPFWKALGKWIEQGQIVPNPVQLVGGGLSGITEALDLWRKGVSGVKLVVRL